MLTLEAAIELTRTFTVTNADALNGDARFPAATSGSEEAGLSE